MALHILTYRHHVVGWQLMLNYMQTPLTHYSLESSRQATYMKTRANPNVIKAAAKSQYIIHPPKQSSYTVD